MKKAGIIILPPEVRNQDHIALDRTVWSPMREVFSEYDLIGTYADRNDRHHPPHYDAHTDCIYLCGATSERHRWGVALDENDFFKQVDALKAAVCQKKPVPVIIGVRRTNFHRLDTIVDFIRNCRGQFPSHYVAPFSIHSLLTISARFSQYLARLNKRLAQEHIECVVVDGELGRLLSKIESEARKPTFVEDDFIRALGPVAKDVFIGPAYLLLDLSGYCNTDCVYCYRHSPWNQSYWDQIKAKHTGFLDLADARQIIEEAAELNVQRILLVGAGEPLMHPQFQSIMDILKSRGIQYNFSTNGLLLNRYYDGLLNGTCNTITISISAASNESFAAIRPNTTPGLLEKIRQNVQTLAKMKKKKRRSSPHLIALYVVCKYNYHEIVDMAIQANEMGADSIWYQLVHLQPFSQEQLYMSEDEMFKVRALLQEARKVCENRGLIFQSFINFELRHYQADTGNWSKEGLLEQGCYVGWHFAYVHLRKEVFMCCGRKVVGTLSTQSDLRQIWFSDAYQRYRNDGLIMHRENPITLHGNPLYDRFCDACDNHDQNNTMLDLLRRYQLSGFVERP